MIWKYCFSGKCPVNISKNILTKGKGWILLLYVHCNNPTVWKRCCGKIFFLTFFSLSRITGWSEMHLEKYRVYQEKSSPRRAYRILVEVALRLGHCYGKTFSGLLSISLERRLVSQVWQWRRQKLYKSAKTVAMFGFTTTTLTNRLFLIISPNFNSLETLQNAKNGLQFQRNKKWPLYCPQGSGTLRQQLLMMHGIAWYCMVLHDIA